MDIEAIEQQWREDVSTLDCLERVLLLEQHYLSKKGAVSQLARAIGSVAPEQRRAFGKKVQALRASITDTLEKARHSYELQQKQAQYAKETIDVTRPVDLQLGGYHPLTRMMDRALQVLCSLGFSVVESPDIDSESYNFDRLNFPKDHPARDMQDSFFLEDGRLLRTQTSNAQPRLLETQALPVRVVAPGTCYRRDDVSGRSHLFFHQIEALYVDENVALSDLVATLKQFFSQFLGKEIALRLRPSYFPFVEPGLEVDISCPLCQGKGCALCKHTGYLEVGGAGMVHPNVLALNGVDPDRYNGFAWGMGFERLVMTLFSLPDIRLFSENDVRFLHQFLHEI